MHNTPVNHRTALNLLHLLYRVNDTATVNGTKEAVRIGGLVFTVELAETIRHDEYDGVYLRTINTAVGELDCTKFGFREHRVTTGTIRKTRLESLSGHTVARLLDGVGVSELEQSIRNHVATFTA